MDNLVTLGTGNSRLMKSNISSSTTLEQLIEMLNNGTFPYDIGPLNSAGISQEGTPLNKGTLFSDETEALYPSGIEDPDGALSKLSGAAIVQGTYLYDIMGNRLTLQNDQISGMVQIDNGTYTGTGTYGSSNPNTLTFQFEPKMVFVYRSIDEISSTDSGCSPAIMVNPYNGSAQRSSSSYWSLLICTWSDNSVSWYGYDAATQKNRSSATYVYIAIG